MFIPFKDLAPTSRIWIFQCNRFLSIDETEKIKELAYEFVNDWTAHKQNLLGSFEIFHNLFLIIGVDESVNDASGCSIDKSVHFIKQVERFFEVDLFNRFNVAYKINHEIKIANVHDLIAELKSTSVDGEVVVFNNLVQTKKEITDNWLLPIEKTWVNNFMN
jgi:hypothetical protein